MNDPLLEFMSFEDENNTLLETLSTIHFNYKALQHGMDLEGILDKDLKDLVERHHVETSALEDFDSIIPSEQYRRFIASTPYAFALEGCFEGLLDWSIPAQALFICLFPGGIFFWCLGILDRIRSDSQAIEKARQELEAEGFYRKGQMPPEKDNTPFIGREEFTEKSLNKYKAASIKAYPAKQLITELEASYNLMRIFCDAATGHTAIKLRQIIPSLKKLGFDVDENRGKIRRNPQMKEQRGSVADLGYGDPNLIKQIFAKITPHTDLLPEFKKALEQIQKQQADKTGITAKLKQFFKVGSREEVKPQDKAYAAIVSQALKVTLSETEALFRMTLNLLATVKKYG